MLFQPRLTGRRPADSTWRPNSSFARCCLYPVELPLFCWRRTRNPTPISALRANTEKLDSYGDDFREKRIRIQRHAVETNSHVSTTVASGRISSGDLENQSVPEGVDGSVLSCIPACSPVAVRRFKKNVTGGLLFFPRKTPSCWLDVHLYGHSWGISQLCLFTLRLYVTARPATRPRSPHYYLRGRRCTAAPNVSERPTTHVPQPLLPGGVRRYVPAWHFTDSDVALLTEQARGGVRQV